LRRDKRASGGKLRYTYDDAVSYQCESLLLIGVGTAMKNSDYDIIAGKISTAKPIVTVFTDHSRTPIKLSDKGYAKLYTSIVDNLGDLIPVCKGKSPKIIIGGHSASGSAAIKSVSRVERKPDGFIGLDPFDIYEKKKFIPPKSVTPVDKSIPIMTWGFEKTTCGTKINNAAKPAYRLAGDDKRVFYRLGNKTDMKKVTHCDFADKGCFGPVCRGSKREDIKDAMAASIHAFVASVKKGYVQASDFAVSTVAADTVSVELFVNADVPE